MSLDNRVACRCVNAFPARFGCAELSRDFGLGKMVKIVGGKYGTPIFHALLQTVEKYDESAAAWITAVVAFLEPETIR